MFLLAELYWRTLMTLLFWERHLIHRCPLRSIFARFPEQLRKDLVSWGSHGECFMIDRFLGEAFGVLSCQFWSIVLHSGALLPMHTLNYWTARAVSGARFLTGGVFECDIFHRRFVAVLCMLCKIRCNPVHPLNGALPGPYVPARVTRGALVAHRYTYAPSRCRTLQYRRTFIPFSVSSGTILLNPYSMVWDWRVSRAGPMLLYWPKLLYPYYSLLLFFPFSSFCL